MNNQGYFFTPAAARGRNVGTLPGEEGIRLLVAEATAVAGVADGLEDRGESDGVEKFTPFLL